MEDGEECAFGSGLLGILVLLKLCADSWDFHYQVRTTHANWDNSFKTGIVVGMDAGFRDGGDKN